MNRRSRVQLPPGAFYFRCKALSYVVCIHKTHTNFEQDIYSVKPDKTLFLGRATMGIHNWEKRYHSAIRGVKKAAINRENKAFILEFADELLVEGISKPRIVKYLSSLRKQELSSECIHICFVIPVRHLWLVT